MTFTTFFPLASAILVFFLGIFVWSKGIKNRVNFTFALFSFAITVWLFGTFMMFFYKDNTASVIFWDKFVYVGVVYIPVIMLHFGFSLTKRQDWKEKVYLVIGYLMSTFFLILIPTKLFVDGAFIYEWGAHTKAQFFHHLFLVYFSIYLLAWFILVYKYYKTTYLIHLPKI